MSSADSGYAGSQAAGNTAAQVAIEICYALPHEQTLLALNVEPGTTLRQAIERSGLIARHPEVDLSTLSVGIFGKMATLDTIVSEGDRIEIYRPLTADPKLARQRRVDKSRSGSFEGRRWIAKERRR